MLLMMENNPNSPTLLVGVYNTLWNSWSVFYTCTLYSLKFHSRYTLRGNAKIKMESWG